MSTQNLFLNNKYTKWYFQIIEKAKSQNRIKSKDVYYESHHIIPRCMNGSNKSHNLVLLTAREHFICHYLLCKMADKNQNWYKLMNAFNYMKSQSKSHNNNRYFNSYLYDYYKKNCSLVMSELQRGEKNSNFGKIWISNIDLKKCIKIQNSELDYYISIGYIKKRILNFDNYKYKKLQKIKNNINQKKINFINCIKGKKDDFLLSPYKIKTYIFLLKTFNINFERYDINAYYAMYNIKNILYNSYNIDNLSSSEIKSKFNFNCSISHVSNILKSLGVERRTFRDASLNYFKNK
jgi:hypothetical protein